MLLSFRWVFCMDLGTDSGLCLYIINWLVFITLAESVYCAVRAVPYIKQISLVFKRLKGLESVVGLVSLRASVIPGGGKACRPTVGSGVLYPEERWPGLKKTTHCHLVLRSEMSGAITPSSLCLHDLQRDSFTFNFIKSLGLLLSNVTGLP
jgi:hypothetical protein